jgi:hypothetical protein
MMRLLNSLFILLFCASSAFAVGAPDYLPDGAHPRIWLTPTVVSALKAKKAANSQEWQDMISGSNGLDTYIWPWATTHMPSGQSFYGLYSWPQGDGYVGSGFYDVITSLGVAYYALKTEAYNGASSVGADDLKAHDYATKAFDLMAQLIPKLSGGEEYDCMEFMRMSDDKSNAPVTINESEASATHPNGFAYTTNGSMSFKSGYAARNLAQMIPLFYDWFYNDPLMSTTTVGGISIKTLLWKAMYRHIDWALAQRSTYNNGVLISGTYYHEDSFHKDWDGNASTYNCTGSNNCTLSTVAAASAYKQYAYGMPNGVGRIGSNFYEPIAGLIMLNAVAAYGDAPTSDSNHYLTLAKTILSQHTAALSDQTIYKGGDSLEGLAYNSNWHSLFQGILAMNTGAGMDIWTGFNFPKELAKNYIHNTDPTLSMQMQRGALNKPSNVAYWHHPTEYSVNIFDHILASYYSTSDEAKQLRYFLNNASLVPLNYNSSAYWQRMLFRNNSFTTMDLSAEPLAYRSIGSGVVTTRSTWAENATDAVTAQIVLGGVFNVDHQAQDQGAMVINRGSDRLLSRLMDSSSNSDESSQGQNSIVFGDGISDGNGPITVQSSDSGMTSGTPKSATPTSPLIDRYANASNYLYVSGDVANVFNGTGNTNLARIFRRSVLHLRPGVFVVYDVTRSNSAISNKKSWYMQFEAAPSIDSANRNISVTKGSSKLFIKGLYPSGGTYTDTDLSSSSNTNMSSVFHRVKYEPATTQEYDQFLHVVEATGSGSSQTASTLITGTGGRGAKVGNTAVMFTSDQAGAGITTVTYTVDATTHYIADLPINSSVEAFRGGVSLGSFDTGDGGIITFTSSSGSVEYTTGEPVSNPATSKLFKIGSKTGKIGSKIMVVQ